MAVTLHTSHGDIKLELYCEHAPRACENFLALCASGYYDGSLFHRSIRGFMVQGGDPTGTGKGGKSIFATANGKFPNEIVDTLKHSRRGIVSMANSGKNDNGSQFFITYKAQPSLNGKYTIFAHVLDGMDALDRIEKVPTGAGDRPQQEVRLKSVIIHANPMAGCGVSGMIRTMARPSDFDTADDVAAEGHRAPPGPVNEELREFFFPSRDPSPQPAEKAQWEQGAGEAGPQPSTDLPSTGGPASKAAPAAGGAAEAARPQQRLASFKPLKGASRPTSAQRRAALKGPEKKQGWWARTFSFKGRAGGRASAKVSPGPLLVAPPAAAGDAASPGGRFTERHETTETPQGEAPPGPTAEDATLWPPRFEEGSNDTPVDQASQEEGERKAGADAAEPAGPASEGAPSVAAQASSQAAPAPRSTSQPSPHPDSAPMTTPTASLDAEIEAMATKLGGRTSWNIVEGFPVAYGDLHTAPPLAPKTISEHEKEQAASQATAAP